MYSQKTIANFSFILFIGMALVSCFKPRVDSNDTDTSLAQNYSYVEQNNNELNNIIIEVIEKTSS